LEGGDAFGVRSTACSYSRPKPDKEANGVMAAVMAALVINDLLEVECVIDYDLKRQQGIEA
jgi:hypothetical protein